MHKTHGALPSSSRACLHSFSSPSVFIAAPQDQQLHRACLPAARVPANAMDGVCPGSRRSDPLPLATEASDQPRRVDLLPPPGKSGLSCPLTAPPEPCIAPHCRDIPLPHATGARDERLRRPEAEGGVLGEVQEERRAGGQQEARLRDRRRDRGGVQDLHGAQQQGRAAQLQPRHVHQVLPSMAAALVTLLFVIAVNLAIGILPHMMRPAPWSTSRACSPPPASRSQRA
ncbi:uncharacterized protein [Aegilops tauschii subsp. strangulata]|nr:uncharacterized protein LOC109743469 [Aegilops tauschii subsp. strangulata]